MIGYRTFGIKPQISLEYQLKRRLYLNLAANYYVPITNSERLYLEEKSGFYFFRRKASLPLTDENVQVLYNGVETTNSHFNVEDWGVSLGLVLRF